MLPRPLLMSEADCAILWICTYRVHPSVALSSYDRKFESNRQGYIHILDLV